MSSTIVGATNEIFCSYAHEDLPYIEALRSHLRQLEREGIISSWYDGLIGAGQHWQREIETHLKSANIILLFISADFLKSDFCMEIELPIALDRSHRKDALVIPVILRPCDWQATPFAHLQALPVGVIPIAQWRHRDEAYTEIVKSIRSFVYSQQVPPMRCSLLNVPFHRNRLFTGREEILEKVYAALESRKETALIQAIKGLGGIGKTQTAIEYAYRYQDHYARIIWLNSGSRETLISDVMRLTREMNTPGCYDQDQNIVVQGFLTWLEKQRNWLLILDNVEDMTLPRTYMPKGSQGHLLLTTRRQAVGGAIEGIPLDVMNEETGATFLLKRAKRIAVDLPFEKIPTKEMQLAMNLSTLLGGLPLALDQAGGYIERKQCSLERYLQIYEQAHQRLLAESGFPEDTTDYRYTVATTWSLSFQQIAQQKYGQAATDLLRLSAFLAPDNIPVLLFETAEAATLLLGLDLGPVVADPFQFEEALEALLKYSLIRREENTLFIHQLVQTVLRDAMTEEERSLWMERAVLVINAIFPSGEHGMWPLCEALLSHALICAKWTFSLRQKKREGARLLTAVGWYLYERAQYTEAEPLLQQAFAIYEEQLGASHPNLAACLNNLAALYQKQGKYAEAESLMKRVLMIKEQVLEVMHPSIAIGLNNLATLYQKQGKYAEAEPLYQRALKINEQVLGAAHPDTADILNNLADFYAEQGKYAEAESVHQRALAIREQQLGTAHPYRATSLNNLAELYRRQGKYEEAEPLHRHALAIREQQLGAGHPDTAQSLNNLALLYLAQGRYEDAEPLLQHALAINEQVLGAAHPDTASRRNNLATLYLTQGRYKEAEPLVKHALTFYEQLSGTNHRGIADILNNLAAIYYKQGKYAEAEPLYQRALAINEQMLGAAHPDAVTSLNNLATLYGRQGKYEEAESLHRHALAICEQQLGANHPDTAQSLNNLALLYLAQGRYEDAGPLLRRTLAINEQVLGTAHPDTATSLNNLAELYIEQGKYEEAEILHRRALAIREQQLGANHPDIAQSLNNLAAFYYKQRKYAEAEPLYQRALAINEQVLGAAHPDTATSLNNLAELYKSQGKYGEAEPVYRRAVEVFSFSLGMEHPQTQQTLMNYLTLLSDRYTNGNLDALLQLLAQKEQDDHEDEASSQGETSQ